MEAHVMKRVLTILAILLLPLSVWAMTPVSDSDLSNVTGQAGVNINADIKMNVSIGTMAWGDSDGLANTPVNPWPTSDGPAGGYIGIKNFNITNLHIQGRSDSNDKYSGYNTLFLKPITIDVATGTKNGVANTTFVRFGLGALKITLDQLQFTVALGTRGTLGSVTLPQEMGVVTLGAMEVYINPWSYVDIYSHAGQGVNFDINVTLDAVNLPYMSWGDTDGIALGSFSQDYTPKTAWMNTGSSMTAGYVGLNNFHLGDGTTPAVIINGAVQIDIGTTASGVYAQLQGVMNGLVVSPMSEADLLTEIASLRASSATISAVLYSKGVPASLCGTIAAAITADANNLANAISAPGTSLTSIQGYTAALYNNANTYWQAIRGNLMNGPGTTVPQTVVHISFPSNFTVTLAKMYGDVVLADASGLGNAAAVTPGTTHMTLGDIYIQGMTAQIFSGSWVDIWAH